MLHRINRTNHFIYILLNWTCPIVRIGVLFHETRRDKSTLSCKWQPLGVLHRMTYVLRCGLVFWNHWLPDLDWGGKVMRIFADSMLHQPRWSLISYSRTWHINAQSANVKYLAYVSLSISRLCARLLDVSFWEGSAHLTFDAPETLEFQRSAIVSDFPDYTRKSQKPSCRFLPHFEIRYAGCIW